MNRREFTKIFGMASVALPLIGRKVLAGTTPQWPHPAAQASVTITFHGMIAAAFGSPGRVSFGLLDAHHHTPKIEIAAVAGSQRNVMAVLGAEQLRGNHYFGAPGGCQRYLTSFPSDRFDLRHVPDFESAEMHGRKLTLLPDRMHGIIHVSSGLFYTAELSERPYRFVAADGSGKTLRFNRRTGEMAGKIQLQDGESFNVGPINIVAENGVNYEISVTNLPPIEMADLSHWAMYYDVIGERVTPYVPQAILPASYRPTPIVCAVGVFGQSSLS